jgi:hypothetical protein
MAAQGNHAPDMRDGSILNGDLLDHSRRFQVSVASMTYSSKLSSCRSMGKTCLMGFRETELTSDVMAASTRAYANGAWDDGTEPLIWVERTMNELHCTTEMYPGPPARDLDMSWVAPGHNTTICNWRLVRSGVYPMLTSSLAIRWRWE